MLACDLCSVTQFPVCGFLYRTGLSEKSWASERDGARKQRHKSNERGVTQSGACLAIALGGFFFSTKLICRILATVVLRLYDFVLHLYQLSQGVNEVTLSP